MNIVHEIRELQKKVNKLYCVFTGEGGGNSSPTTVYDHTVNITDDTLYATIGDTQLTFNKNVSDFLAANIPDNAQIGETTTTNSTVEVAVHPSGVNFVTINGQTVYKSTPNSFTYTPVSPNKVKELILYGKLDSTMIYLAEGEEGDQAVSPSYDGLLIKRILVNNIEEVIIDIDYDAFKMKSDDTWGFVYINNNNGVWEYVNRTNYAISKTVNITTPLLLGFYSNGFSDVWNGKRILLKNTTDVDVLLKATPTPAPGSRVYFSFYEDKVLKPNEYITIVLENDNKFHYTSVPETLTTIEQPVLTGNILTIKYIGENGELQQQNIDLSGLATIDVTITDASYNASTNIITLTDSNGDTFSVDLSEFSLLVSIDANGIATLTQEGVTKLQISKVGRTGDYNDLLNKPTIPAPVDVSGKEDKSNKQNNLTPDGTGIKYPTVDAVNTKNTLQDSAIATETATRSGVENLMHHFWDSNTGKWLSSGLKYVIGAINQLEFNGRMKIAALILPPNTDPNVANRLWSDGNDVYYDNNLAVPNKFLFDNEGFVSVTSNVTIDNSYHGRIVRIGANCTITLPLGLRNDFISYFVVIGGYTVTFVGASGVFVYAPFGSKMLEGDTCYIQKVLSNRFDLIGNLTPA